MAHDANIAAPLQPGNGYQLPPEAYYQQEWFALEGRRLFRRTWNFVGETRDLEGTGAYLTADIGGAPVLVLRDKQGRLRAFHNVCRHRGAKLLDGSGHCSAIVCPYHRWRYDLDGALNNVPQQARELAELERSDWGLLPVAVAEWAGLVFVNPDGRAPELLDWLAGIPELLGAFEPERLKVVTAGAYEFRANWKFYIENHVDWYHLWYTHPKTLRMWDHHAGEMLQTGAHWASFEPAAKTEATMTPALATIDGLDERQRQNGAHLVFPNLTLFTGAGYFATGLVQPLGPERARMHFRALVSPEQEVTPELSASMLQAFREITEVEDADMTERLQAAVRSDAYAVGPMTMHHEAPIARLHDEYLAVFDC